MAQYFVDAGQLYRVLATSMSDALSLVLMEQKKLPPIVMITDLDSGSERAFLLREVPAQFGFLSYDFTELPSERRFA